MTARSLAPFDPDVVSPWRQGEGNRGVLLIHGFAGTPPELRRLGNHLADRGWRCYAPALAGHATDYRQLATTSWSDWAASAHDALDELAHTCDEVMVVGQSMGGTLALHLAATDTRIRAVACLAAPIWIGGPGAHLLPVTHRFVHWHRPHGPIDLYFPSAVEELYSYGIRSTRAINELMTLLSIVRDEVALVRQPVLLCHGRRDLTVDPRNALDIERKLVCSADVERHMFSRSGHALSVDVDRETINDLVGSWFERHHVGALRA